MAITTEEIKRGLRVGMPERKRCVVLQASFAKGDNIDAWILTEAAPQDYVYMPTVMTAEEMAKYFTEEGFNIVG